jgi:predicted GIY-YIG superfamily endonuclease
MDILSYVSDEQLLESAGIDPTRFKLGKPCKRGHTWQGTGKCLRRMKPTNCIQCIKERDDDIHMRHDTPEDNEYLEAMFIDTSEFRLGQPCLRKGHLFYQTNKSLRYRNSHRCFDCVFGVKTGIYKIECLVNGNVYIGQSLNIKLRWNKHKAQLRNGNHDNDYLQNSWNAYGEENFKFSLLMVVDKKLLKNLIKEQKVALLNILEQTYFTLYNPEFNSAPIAGSNKKLKHRKKRTHKKSAKRSSSKRSPLRDSTKRKIGLAHAKPFTLYHPDEGYIRGYNLAAFADSRSLNRGNLAEVVSGRRPNSQGYFKDEEAYIKWKEKMFVPFSIYHPDRGYIYDFNYHKWAVINKLNPSGIRQVLLGEKPSSNGYFKDEESYLLWKAKKDNQGSLEPGVYFYDYKKSRRWGGCIYVDKKTIDLGYFDTEEEAIAAVRQARIDNPKKFKRSQKVA